MHPSHKSVFKFKFLLLHHLLFFIFHHENPSSSSSSQHVLVEAFTVPTAATIITTRTTSCHSWTYIVNQHQHLGKKLGLQTKKTTTENKYNRNLILEAGFFDGLMNGNLFNNDDNQNNEKKNSNNSINNSNVNEKSTENQENEKDSDELMEWNEADFQKEVQKRNEQTNNINESQIENTENNSNKTNDQEEFDGYAFRDAIYQKWGKCYDVDFQPVQTFGFRELYLNVLPFHLGGRRFRHESELDYLCHLQAIVEILEKYDQLDYVLSQLDETTKKPRPGTSPLVAVPFRLDLTEDELNSILA